MNAMILKLLQISLCMSAAILLMAVLSRLLRRKTSAAARLACWLAVALGLLIPVRPQLYTLPLPGFMSSITEPIAVRLAPRVIPAALMDPSGEPAQVSVNTPGMAEYGQQPGLPAAAPAETAAEPSPFDAFALLPYIWALGSLAVIAVSGMKHIRFLRMLRRWGQPVSEEVCAFMAQIGREVGLKRRVRLLVSPVITTPLLIGLFRPVIVLPDEEIDSSALRFILLHETLHLKRGDIWAKALSLLALAVHWFNPLVWLMDRAIAAESEAACDKAVLRYAGQESRFQYGKTVLLIARRGKQAGVALSSAMGINGRKLKKRLDAIVERANPKRWVSVSCAAVLFAALLLPIGLTGFTVSSGDAMDGPDMPLPEVTEAAPAQPNDDPSTPTELGLKDIYKDYFLIGTAGGVQALQGPRLDLITRHFSAFTYENEMKPGYVQSEEGRFNFTGVDAITAELQKNNIAAIGHTLAWYQQTPDWMWQENAKERLEAHIEAVIRHSGPYLTSIDVVNEAFADYSRGEGWRGNLNQAVWYEALGPDYIEIAFRKADEVRRAIGRPDLKLYYNDYSLYVPGKANEVYEMVTELRAKGVPIDGIGMQSHYTQYLSVDAVRRSLELFATIPGLEISVTELDIGIAASDTGLTAEEDALQGRLYAELFSLYKEYAQGPANPDVSKRLIARVTVWGTTDDTSWLGKRYPLLFDREFAPKSAYYAVADPETYLAGPV